ncbi:hypothetical protein HF086_006083 [Spodoptera exigua]|uniref:ATP-dependent RNA helicase n=1 Tax=Spodoptera exigua TaxID=7107 RepID=A0A922MSD9_SPOEX|nr:hypothetical protein HF086_006083 [Spodoptera exigua]
MTAFEEFGVLPELGKAIEEMDWTLPTDVQAEAVPLILGGGDVLMAAETGSGKTGAFCLPILQIVWETLKDIQEGKTSKIIQTISTELTMSFFDRNDALAVTPDGLRCQSRDPKGWHGCRATKGVHSKGAYYYEATVTDEGLCRVGWSTQAARLDLGTDRMGYGFGGTGKKSNNKNFNDYGEPFGMHDVIGCLLNLNTGEISYTKNGVNLGVAFNLDPNRRGECYFPAVVLKNAEMSFNFGKTPFKYPPPAEYVAIASAPKDCMKVNPVSSDSAVEATPANNAPRCIIIEPSRELAEQTCNQITKFKKYLENPKIRELLVVGGINVKDQINALNAGIDIVVGTPGRLEDLIQGDRRAVFVIDWSISQEKLMHFPTWVDLKGEDSVPETVHHVVVNVDPQKDRSWETLHKHVQTDGVHSKDNIRSGNTTPETLSEAVKILKGEYCVRAIREHKMDRAIIFCRTKLDCDNMERYLKSYGSEFSCVCLHGDRKPAERKGNLEKFKSSQVKFLICTDVAARGIDISGLPFMINVTLPDEKSNYVHRIGRVGRAERMGLAISLVSTVPEKVWYHGEWCSSRGRNCWNTNLTDDHPRGCCMWYNEPQYLADIEDHLTITIQQIATDMKVPANEFDGKVVYGQKLKQTGSGYQDHVSQMAPVVKSLQELESQAQLYYLKLHHNVTIG